MAGPPSADADRLPRMTPAEEVKEKQRLQDLKDFREFLVDTRSVKCLMKLFQHVAQKEMRLDNPGCVKEFIENYEDDGPEARERARLERQKEGLLARQQSLQDEVSELEKGIDEARRLIAAKKVWKALTKRGGSITVGYLFDRICGTQDEVKLLRPDCVAEAAEAEIEPDAFWAWAACLPEEQREWLNATLLPNLSDPATPPFEKELVQAVRKTGLYPRHFGKVKRAVPLDDALLAFLEVASARFAVPASAEAEEAEECEGEEEAVCEGEAAPA